MLGSSGPRRGHMHRRALLQAGGLGLFGLSLSRLLEGQVTASPAGKSSAGRARSCIVLFMMGGPPQHETWDPKPEAPAEVRGEFGQIATSVSGLNVGELMPRLARLADRCCVLRGVSTGIDAHSSSGYWMLTGREHPRGNVEVAGEFRTDDAPSLGAMVRRALPDGDGLPAAVTLPEPIFNNPRSLWPGQYAGFLGRRYDPWLLECDPSAETFGVPEITLPDDVPPGRLADRRRLLERLGRLSAEREHRYDGVSRQAFDLLLSGGSRQAFDLEREPEAVREQYGRHKFGQSCLLARRLIESGVRLVQVNWPREPGDSQVANPVWDTHQNNFERLRIALMPPMDVACSALLDDLDQRGLLDETLVVWMGEFGRTPTVNAQAGRDHWGRVFSVMLAGGGIRGGQVHGASDRLGAVPVQGLVRPQDLLATIFHSLGLDPHTEIHDPLGRPFPLSNGEVIRELF